MTHRVSFFTLANAIYLHNSVHADNFTHLMILILQMCKMGTKLTFSYSQLITHMNQHILTLIFF